MSQEDITGILLMPAVMREAWKNPDYIKDIEACMETCKAYSAEIDSFANSTAERTKEFYDKFRITLNTYCLIFQKDYPLLKYLTNKQIDNALEKIREARKEHAAQAEKTHAHH